jgi:O-antigen ligase
MTEGTHRIALSRAIPRAPFGAWRDPAAWILTVDVLSVLVAVALPWSTSGVAIFMVIWFLALVPTLEPRALLHSLTRPASALPLAFFVLAVVGTLWADSPWPARLHGINPVVKLLAIPFLLYHFERSQRANWVFVAFLISCALLMALSWIVMFAPEFKVTSTASQGVPVKNYIDQSQEFALCLFALASLVPSLFDQRRFALASACIALIVGFFFNMMFVVSARTALVYIPVLLVLFAILHLSRRGAMLLFAGAMATAALIWITSPYLRDRVEAVAVEYQNYHEKNAASSTGLRLEYWRKSLHFFAEAPLLGNGTGSTKQLFERDAVGRNGASADVIGNPHNQTLNVAVQWGLLGCVVLYAMWFCHLLLFFRTNPSSWIGILVVVQNVTSSLLNSHLFDFHEGWMYVLGVGVAGGMAFKTRSSEAGAGPELGQVAIGGVQDFDKSQSAGSSKPDVAY